MADIFSVAKRSEIMSRIRGKDTGPELMVRKYLFSKGLRYRLHGKGLPGRPDIVLKKYGTVVIVNGCFWHGHSRCPIFKMPKSKTAFWRAKILRNRARDERDLRALRKLGWKPVVVWECQLKKDRFSKTMERIVRKVLG